MRTKRRLGQNFLYDTSIIRRIVESARLSPGDRVVEIGPGPGTLTRVLSEKAGHVTAIELDPALYERLRAEFAGYRNVELVLADALKYPFEEVGEFKVVANIPYYITTPIIFRLLEAKGRMRSMTLTIQKEVAERIVARPGGKDYGVLSIMVQYRAMPEMKFIIPAGAFRPVPKVDSAVIHIEVRQHPAVSVADEKLFFRVIKTAFSQRRKTIANSLKGMHPDMKSILNQAGIDPMRRPETLTIEDFAAIADLMAGGKA